MMRRENILVVDDTPESLSARILEDEGYEVQSVISGERALCAVSILPPDLVVLDIDLPDMDGYEVCRRLKADPATRDVPIILAGAVSETDDKQLIFEAGAADFLTKPCHRGELLARVRTHLELHRLRHRLEALVDERTADLQESVEHYRQLFDKAAIALDEAETGEVLDGAMAPLRDKAELAGRHQKIIPSLSAPFLLLVDDEENVLNSLVRVFRREGYRILRAGSAQEALGMLAANEVGVIVSDQRMPEMNGVEFLRQAKGQYPDSMRIVLSGYTDLQSVTDAINEGAVYKFITKPWEDEPLRNLVREAFRDYSANKEREAMASQLAVANDELSHARFLLARRGDAAGVDA
ncbi:MAG: response regulator [Gallionella sp.]|nr:response regulator [Gallionella sp.]